MTPDQALSIARELRSISSQLAAIAGSLHRDYQHEAEPPPPQSPVRDRAPDALFPDLPIKERFSEGFLLEKIEQYGEQRVRQALGEFSMRIASGRIRAANRALAWKVLESILKALESDDRTAASEELKKRAFLNLFKTSTEPFYIGKYKLRWDGSRWFLDGQPSRMEPSHLEGWMEREAGRLGWRIVPATEGAERALKDHRMFPFSAMPRGGEEGGHAL